MSSVLDEGSQPLEYEESRKGRYKRIKIWVPGASDEIRTVHIEYSVENALRFIDAEDSDFEAGHDELYWNVTGDEWEDPYTRRDRARPGASRGHWPDGSCVHGFPRFTSTSATATEIE